VKIFTEKELFKQNTINIEYCSMLEKDGIVSLDDLSELIPGFIHLNNTCNHGLEYVSKKGLDIFEKTIDEIKAGGQEFLKSISDKKSQAIYLDKKMFLLNNNHLTYSHFQRLHYKEKSITPTLFYTTSKLFKTGDSILSFTQPLHLLQQDSFLKNIVEDRFVFFNKNIYKFKSLTTRECEILRLIANGDSNKTISEKLFISSHTVKTHRKNICRKLETGKLIDIVKFAQVFLNE
jgi:DNA-binding CsgD family transcriptional regulator